MAQTPKGLLARLTSKKLPDYTDAELVAACRQGNQEAWDEVVNRYQRLIATVPRHAGLNEDEVSDVFQEVFVTLVKKLDEIEQPDKLRSWLVTTAKFKTWSLVRGERGKESLDDEENQNIAAGLTDSALMAEEAVVEIERQHIVRTAVRQLEDTCRTIVEMLYLADPSATYAEVAQAIGVGETSISPMRARCLKKLAKLLPQEIFQT